MDIEGGERKLQIMFNLNENKIIEKISAFQVKEKLAPLQLKDINTFKKLTKEQLNEYQKI